MSSQAAERPEIDGETRLIAIIGDPIRQVRSPAFYNRILAEAGVNAVLLPWQASAGDFDPVMAGLMRTGNLDGIVVTYPHKQRAVAFADALEPMAARLKSVNVLRREADGRWRGAMFDGQGLLEAARQIGFDAAGAAIQLAGGGGAGSAIAHALAEQGAARLVISETDRDRLEALTVDLRAHYPRCRIEAGTGDLRGIDLLVNATPVGLADEDGLPFPVNGLSDRTSVIDIVPGRETPLLRAARSRGCRTLGGSAMVEGQAGIVLRFLNKIEADRPGAAGNPVPVSRLHGRVHA